MDTISIEVRRLERVVDNLLALSRLQAGALAPMPEVWTVEDLVYEALAEVGRSTDRVNVSVPPDTPPVLVDAVQMRQILGNLIDNALKFSPEGSPVTVRVNRTRKEVIVRVIDQGRGLPENELEHVFEPFYRGAPAQDQTGTGPRPRHRPRVRGGKRRPPVGGVAPRPGRRLRAGASARGRGAAVTRGRPDPGGR